MGALGMQKSHSLVFSHLPRLFVDELDPLRLDLTETLFHILHFERDMVNSFTLLLQKLSHDAFGVDGLDQLDSGLPDGKEGDLGLRIFRFINEARLDAKCFFIESDSLLKVFNGDTNVVN